MRAWKGHFQQAVLSTLRGAGRVGTECDARWPPGAQTPLGVPLVTPWHRAFPCPPAQLTRARLYPFAEGLPHGTGAYPSHIGGQNLGTCLRSNSPPATDVLDGHVPQSHLPLRVPARLTRSLTLVGWSPFPDSQPHSPIGASWVHLPSKRLALKPLPRLYFWGTQSRTPPSLLRFRTHGTSPMLEREHPNVISFPRDSDPAVVTVNTCDLILDMKPKVSWWLHTTQQKSPHPVSRRGSTGQGIHTG